MDKLRFYISILFSSVVLAVAAGLSSGIPLEGMMKRVPACLVVALLASSCTYVYYKKWMPELDHICAAWGLDLSPDGDARYDIPAGIIAGASAAFLVIMMIFSLYSPYVTAGYIGKARLSDTKLLDLAAVDEYNYRRVAAKYHFSIDASELGRIPQAAVSRMRSPERIKEAAVELGKDYRPVAEDPKSLGFLKALERLKSMKREDCLVRVFYGLREHGKDRGIGAPIGALIKVVEVSGDKKFIQSVAQDVAMPSEVKNAAEARLRRM